jgi:hypothetical protein
MARLNRTELFFLIFNFLIFFCILSTGTEFVNFNENSILFEAKRTSIDFSQKNNLNIRNYQKDKKLLLSLYVF